MFKNLSPEALGISATQSEMIELALSFGFRGIDLNVVEFAERAKDYGLPRARRLLDSGKLKIGRFVLPVAWEADDATFRADLRRLTELASTAAQVGATRSVTQVEPASDERAYHQNFEFHRQRLADTAAALEPLGVRLGVGFVASADARRGKAFEFIHDLEALIVLLSTVGARNLGVELDLWQVWASGRSLDGLRGKLRPQQIVSVLVADAEPSDAPDEQPATARRLPGETGVIDTTGALAWLAEIGYQGPVTPAPHSSCFAGLKRDAIVRLAGEKLEAAWKAAGVHATGKLSAAAGR